MNCLHRLFKKEEQKISPQSIREILETHKGMLIMNTNECSKIDSELNVVGIYFRGPEPFLDDLYTFSITIGRMDYQIQDDKVDSILILFDKLFFDK